jgi:hypothetical protein
MINKERMREYNQSFKEAHPDYKKLHYYSHLLEYKAWHNERVIRLKTQALTYYGNGKLACVKCGYGENINALTIDHINGCGTKNRLANGGSGYKFYYWLIKNGCPEGYQTLCANCQAIKKIENNENGSMTRLN